MIKFLNLRQPHTRNHTALLEHKLQKFFIQKPKRRETRPNKHKSKSFIHLFVNLRLKIMIFNLCLDGERRHRSYSRARV